MSALTQPSAPAPAPAADAAPRRSRTHAAWARAAGFLTPSVALLGALFLGPMIAMVIVSFQHGPISGQVGPTFANYTSIFQDSLYADVALRTLYIATIAMVVQLLIAFPLAYIMAFKAGRFEIPLLLALVLADELSPMVRIYAWRMLLGREGIINSGLMSLGIVDQPVDALLFSRFAVIVVLSTSWITYTAIPIYAAMKAVDKRMFEASKDLGAGWWTTLTRVLLPLVAPGVFIALLLVYIPLFTDFATPTLVGGPSGYMLGNTVNDLVLGSGDLNGGAAMSMLLLLASALFSLVAFRLARINRLETSS